MPVTIRIDKDDLNALEVMLGDIKNGVVDAIRMALNKTVDGVATDAGKLLSTKINLTQKVIKGNFKKFKATRDSLGAKFESKGQPIPLINFGARQTKKGVSVQVLKSEARKVIPHTFISTMKSGHQGVFWRMWHDYGAGPPKTTGRKIPWKALPAEYRLKIHERFGPRIEDILGKTDVFTELTVKAQARMDKNLDDAANYILVKNKAITEPEPEV